MAMMMWVAGVILEVISRNHWKQFELALIQDSKTKE